MSFNTAEALEENFSYKDGIYDLNPNTFGVEAVKSVVGVVKFDSVAAYAAKAPDVHDSFTDAYQFQADSYFEELGVQMNALRQQVLELNPMQQQILEDYCAIAVPEPLKNHKQDREHTGSWASWLGSEANDAELRAFVEWHVDKIHEQQVHPKVQTAIEVQRELYKIQLQAALETGWIHEDARTAIRMVNEVKVYIGDVFDTLMQERGGYHQRGTNEVVIAAPLDGKIGENGDEGLLAAIKHVAGHEFNHAVLGRLGRRWLDEAITEHINLSLQHGQPKESDPDKRNIAGYAYVEERTLLATLLNKGFAVIPVELATLAYSSDFENTATVAKFRQAVEDSWAGLAPDGADVIECINARISKLEVAYMAAGKSQREAQAAAVLRVNEELTDSALRDIVFAPTNLLLEK